MTGVTARLQGEDWEGAARSAFADLGEAARQVTAAAGGGAAMLASALLRLAEATQAAEELTCRQITFAAIGAAACSVPAPRRGLRSV